MIRLGIATLVLALLTQIPPTTAATSVTFECNDPSGSPTTGCVVLLDPDIHGGSAGTVLFAATSAGKRTIVLPDGPHRLAVVALARTSTGTNTSVLVMQTQPTGCASGWAPLTYQSWWSDTGQDPYFGSRHAHIDNLCWPVNNKVVTASTVSLDVPVQLHNQPAGAKLTRVRGWSSKGGDFWVCTPSKAGTNGCPAVWPTIDANGDLLATFRATIPFSAMANGRHEFRWGVYVCTPAAATVPGTRCTIGSNTKGGVTQLLSSRSQVCDGSCSPAFRSGTFQGVGSWYANDTIGYEDARIHSAWPVVP